MALVLCLVSTMAFGQLNISGGGNRKTDDVKFASDGYGAKVIFNGEKYLISVSDQYSATRITFTIGTTADEARTSLQQLIDWISTSKTQEYLTLTEGDQEVTIYKHSGSAVIVSYGNAEYCKRIYNYEVAGILLDIDFGNGNAKNPAFGYLSKGLLSKALKKIQ